MGNFPSAICQLPSSAPHWSALVFLLAVLNCGAYAQLIIERTVAVNQTIADREQYVSTIVWADTGLSSISRVAVTLSFMNASATRPMIFSQFTGTLTHGTASESERMAVLFSPTNALSGFSPTYTVESALDGEWLASNSWSLLVKDEVKGGGLAVWNSWTLTVEGDASSAGATLRPGQDGKIRLAANATAVDVASSVLLDTAGTFETSAGQSISLNGAVAGSGDLVKTGSGGLSLAGSSADFTGNVRVEQGTLDVKSTTALGRGTLYQSNGSSTVRFGVTGTISNAMSVYKTAFTTNETTLAGTVTVNNAEFDVAAGDTNTITGQITGSGGVTKTGLGTLVLGGTTTNDFTGASAVNAGTLFLNKTAGTTAISGSTIAVNSGGTLLLGAANQISDGTVVNLAGGTLAVGGNSDTVGRLTLSADSIFDFGTAGGSASSFTFGDFNTSAYNGVSVLTINNAAVGSSLVFNVDYTNDATFNTFASKIQFGTTGQFGQITFGTGTTTLLVAIPDARIAWAAGFLCGLIGLVELRRRRPRSARPV